MIILQQPQAGRIERVSKQVQVLCEMCDGTGQMHVTHDMAIDAGNLNLSGQLISCGACGGDGFKIEERDDA